MRLRPTNVDTKNTKIVPSNNIFLHTSISEITTTTKITISFFGYSMCAKITNKQTNKKITIFFRREHPLQILLAVINEFRNLFALDVTNK